MDGSASLARAPRRNSLFRHFVALVTLTVALILVAIGTWAILNPSPEIVVEHSWFTWLAFPRMPEDIQGRPDHCTFTIAGQRYERLPRSREDEILLRCLPSPGGHSLLVVYRAYQPSLRTQRSLPPNFLGSMDGLVTIEDSMALITVQDHHPVVNEMGRGRNFDVWLSNGLRFRDGREYNMRTRTWRGCGPTSHRSEEVGAFRIDRGQFCDAAAATWCRVYFGDTEVSFDGQASHAFEECIREGDTQSLLVAIGTVDGVVSMSEEGRPMISMRNWRSQRGRSP